MIVTKTRDIAYHWKADAEKALLLSKQTNLYYRMNDLYRFLFIQALEEHDGEPADNIIFRYLIPDRVL